MGVGLDWATGAALRAAAPEDARYSFPDRFHPRAAVIAVASPALATLLVILTALLRP